MLSCLHVFVTSCHLGKSLSVMRSLHTFRLPKLPGCGSFWLKSIILILSCMSPPTGTDKSWACSACSLGQMNLSQFPPGSNLAKSAQHHVLTNKFAYHNHSSEGFGSKLAYDHPAGSTNRIWICLHFFVVAVSMCCLCVLFL